MVSPAQTTVFKLGKDGYIISDIPDKLSPFLSERCDRVFKTIKEAKKELFK